MINEDAIRRHYETVRPSLNERGRRLFAAAEVRALGRGGLAAVARATGMARSTIGRGLKDLDGDSAFDGRVRRPGGGCKGVVDRDPTVLDDLRRLVAPATRGDPERPLLWVSKSLAKLTAALREMGHAVGPTTVRKLLGQLGFTRQGNRKAVEGTNHPDRDAQFEHINATVVAFENDGQPVISVDTKKKELVGNFKNGGTDWRGKGRPRRVNVHDFADKTLGKVIPYGVYDIGADSGWVSVGVDHDTAAFAVNSIRRWYDKMGRGRYPTARRLMVTADCGGSNGARVRLWKIALQKFADDTAMTLSVCHYPPGTSKWNKIEHRLFCHITRNWRGLPLEDLTIVVNLIGSTKTEEGLEVHAWLDRRQYEKSRKVSDAQLAEVRIKRNTFHGDWNYEILPSS